METKQGDVFDCRGQACFESMRKILRVTSARKGAR